jgi:tetratricopeptide (TPR) repeat protein
MDVQELIDEAEDALLDGELDRAQRAGERLLDARQTYGFEILARVHQQRGDLVAAIAVLEDGVSRAPRAWPLRLLLGELHSESGDYDAALEAYDGATAVEGADLDDLHVNAAIVLHRAGRYEDALKRLDRAPGETDESIFAAARVRTDVLNVLGRPDDALKVAEAGLEHVTDDIDTGDVAELYTSMAKAAFMKGDHKEAVRRAREALALDRDSETARGILRELERR